MPHDVGVAALGGVLVGLGASLLLAGIGDVAGISGIFFRSLLGSTVDRGWRVAFVVGMLGAGAAMAALRPGSVGDPAVSLGTVAVSGLVVGFGTRLGGGCTSGHGVCTCRRWCSSLR